MKKADKAKAIMQLLKQGYSPKEITQRVAVSYNYAWKLKRLMKIGRASCRERVSSPV